ncbi:MAG: glutamine--fructose-6-phosphate transaminase (isomerizing) [Endomicrobium sp.]|jgi:glucosamine--fructose-6-phosphate aminotransferase (isomerizing)|nr:glutamine--fructose-6-phosphate transaminase (isomerizing) [Endomicrobium sp.]
MCGIIGYVGTKNAVDVIFNGLNKLEYRGYDSAGIAIVTSKNKLLIKKSIGKVDNLKKKIEKYPIFANIGIGHTRWATHGKSSKKNAHPHVDHKKNIALVHNGVIENYSELKKDLKKSGCKFISETDTEVIVHLIKKNYTYSLFNAVRKTLNVLTGSYALGILYKNEPDRIVCVKQDSPLIIGVGNNENFIASDISAILPYTRDMIFLENGDIAEITMDKIIIKDVKNNIKIRQIKNIKLKIIDVKKNGYNHFMLKEIFEQPSIVENILKDKIINDKDNKVLINEFKIKGNDIINVSNIYIVACGTSYHSGLVAKFLFEKFVKIPTEVDFASEFKYRDPILKKESLVIIISQSGETADTLSSLRIAKNKGCKTIAICNVVGSFISREATYVLYTHCGVEKSVASTKSFVGQLTILYMLVLEFLIKREIFGNYEIKKYIKELVKIPSKISEFLKETKSVTKIAEIFKNKKNCLYLGRHINYPIALEGALKLKEISYIHAEGYAAGEMKHGPIALIDKSMPVVVIAVESKIYQKIISNIEEARARGGIIIAIASKFDKEIIHKSDHVIYVPRVNEFISPFLTVIPLQLLAYYIAVLRGCNIDQPRNLAKSVTVE